MLTLLYIQCSLCYRFFKNQYMWNYYSAQITTIHESKIMKIRIQNACCCSIDHKKNILLVNIFKYIYIYSFKHICFVIIFHKAFMATCITPPTPFYTALLLIHFARSGISMFNNFSTARAYACSLHIMET